MTKLLPIFLIFISFAGHAAQTLNCEEDFKNLCLRLKNNHGPILHRSSSGLVVLNPAYPTSVSITPDIKAQFLNYPAAIDEENITNEQRLSYLSRVNEANFRENIVPMFIKLINLTKTITRELQQDSSTKRILDKTLSNITFKVLNRPRCHQEERPFVASWYSKETSITICPIMTHMPAEIIASTLAHEIGHVIDPCLMWLNGMSNQSLTFRGAPYLRIHQSLRDHFYPGPNNIKNMVVYEPFPHIQVNACPDENGIGSEETVADYLGAAIYNLALKNNIIQAPTDVSKDVKATMMMYYRTLPICDSDTIVSIRPLLNAPKIQRELACSGLGPGLNINFP